MKKYITPSIEAMEMFAEEILNGSYTADINDPETEILENGSLGAKRNMFVFDDLEEDEEDDI